MGRLGRAAPGCTPPASSPAPIRRPGSLGRSASSGHASGRYRRRQCCLHSRPQVPLRSLGLSFRACVRLRDATPPGRCPAGTGTAHFRAGHRSAPRPRERPAVCASSGTRCWFRAGSGSGSRPTASTSATPSSDGRGQRRERVQRFHRGRGHPAPCGLRQQAALPDQGQHGLLLGRGLGVFFLHRAPQQPEGFPQGDVFAGKVARRRRQIVGIDAGQALLAVAVPAGSGRPASCSNQRIEVPNIPRSAR